VLKFRPHRPAAIRDIAVQSDGKLVAVGRWHGRFAVLRLLPNGSLDPTFSGNGKLTTEFPDRTASASAIAIQGDGKIIVAGTVGGCCGPHGGWFGIVRYLPDGTRDLAFGGGDGRVRAEFSRSFDSCNAVALQSDGKIVAAGERSLTGLGSSFALMRFNADGTLDTSFDGDGKQTVDFSSENLLDRAIGVAVQPDGKIVAGGGGGFRVEETRFAVARLNADGSLDSAFGSGGKALSELPINSAWGFALSSDGKILLGGDVITSLFRFALARFEIDGSPDASFGGDGFVTTRFPDSLDGLLWDVEVQPDGRSVAVGAAGRDFAVARYNVDGTLDMSFDGDGRATTSWNRRWGGANAFAAALQPDGKIVATGDAEARPDRLLVARYLGS